jgi:hypothetical protein
MRTVTGNERYWTRRLRRYLSRWRHAARIDVVNKNITIEVVHVAL